MRAISMALIAAKTTGPPPWPQKLILNMRSQSSSVRIGSLPMIRREMSCSMPMPAGAA